MPLKRTRLAARRKSVGLSQESLAEALGVDRSTVARWESGETEPQPWLRPRLARVLAVSMDELTGLLATGVMAAEPAEQERLRFALEHPQSADLVTVAALRREVQRLDEQYVHVPSASLLAPAGQCLGQVRFLSTHATRSRVRRDLLALEAEAAILMGQLVWDASQRRDHATARMYLDEATAAASQVRDPVTQALALLRKAMISLYGEHDPAAGLSEAQASAEASEQASNVLAGLATLHVAEAHAMQGDRALCEKALAAADARLNRADDSDAAIDLFSQTQAGRMAGSCYLSLSDTSRARRLLEGTAAAMRDQSKAQAVVLGNLALALIRQGQLDEAAGRLHQAMDVIQLNWGAGGLNLIFSAARELRPWRTVPAVQDVSDRLLTLMAG
jgi:transcriptional regulator with XRE-family HTH domain